MKEIYCIWFNGDCFQSVFPTEESEKSALHNTILDAFIYMKEQMGGFDVSVTLSGKYYDDRYEYFENMDSIFEAIEVYEEIKTMSEDYKVNRDKLAENYVNINTVYIVLERE